jgi:hypothetical protein
MKRATKIINELYQLYELNKLVDNRVDGSADQFYAGQNKNELVLADTHYDSYKYHNIIIVDTKKKAIFYKTDDIRIGNIKNTRVPILISYDRLQYMKKELERFKIIPSGYTLPKKEKIKVPSDLDVPFYHGTTVKNLKSILQLGLRPQDTKNLKSYFRGNSSTIGGYTDKCVYFTPNLKWARMYARSQAKHNKSQSAVLMVGIPDKAKLVPDDGVILGGILTKVHAEVNRITTKPIEGSIEWENSSNEREDGPSKSTIESWKEGTQERVFPEIPYIDDYGYLANLLVRKLMGNIIINKGVIDFDMITSDFVWKAQYHDEMLNRYKLYIQWFGKVAYDEYKKLINVYWKKSAYGSAQAVAYMGRIPAKFLKVYR